MKVNVEPGKYILAVSGGIDSVVLLDLLAKEPALELVVAHFNHGIRSESGKDEQFVGSLANKYGLPLEIGYGKLGPDASEELARDTRYQFLNDVKEKHEANSIITAHHQDDLIETAIINLLRGTGRRGLVAMLENQALLRPLINTPKTEILKHARQQNLNWVEDASNLDPKYLRNFIRAQVLNKLSPEARQEILTHIRKIKDSHQETEEVIENLSQKVIKNDTIDRQSFIFMPSEVAAEILINWLKKRGITDVDRPTINRLLLAIKTGRPNTKQQIRKGSWLELRASSVQISNTL